MSAQTLPLRFFPETQLRQSSAVKPHVSQGEVHKSHVPSVFINIPGRQVTQVSAPPAQVEHGLLQESHELVATFNHVPASQKATH